MRLLKKISNYCLGLFYNKGLILKGRQPIPLRDGLPCGLVLERIGTDGKSPPAGFDVSILIGLSDKCGQLTDNTASNLSFCKMFGKFFPEFFYGVEVSMNLPGTNNQKGIRFKFSLHSYHSLTVFLKADF